MADIQITGLPVKNLITAGDYLAIDGADGAFKIDANNMLSVNTNNNIMIGGQVATNINLNGKSLLPAAKMFLPYEDTTANDFKSLLTYKSNLTPAEDGYYFIPGGWNTITFGYTTKAIFHEENTANNALIEFTTFHSEKFTAMKWKNNHSGNETYGLYLPNTSSLTGTGYSDSFLQYPGDAFKGEGWFAWKYFASSGMFVVDFSARVTTASSTTGIYKFIYPSTFSAALNTINTTLKASALGNLTLQPVSRGNVVFYNSSYTPKSMNGYGGVCNATSDYTGWTLGRMYTSSNSVGNWGPSTFAVGDIIQGTLYAYVR